MSSGPIVQRKNSIDEILSLISTQGSEIARAAAEFFAPDVREGEEPADFVYLQTLVARALERRFGDLFHADDVWHRLLAEERNLRSELTAVLAPFRRQVKSIREIGRGIYEADSGKPLSLFHGELPRDAHGVAVLASKLLVWMDEVADHPDFPVKKKRRAIQDGLAEVREVLERLAAARARTLAARLEKKRVLREFNEDFVNLAGLVEGLCGLAGYEDWKKLVQASRQEKGLLVSVLKRRRAAAAGSKATDS